MKRMRELKRELGDRYVFEQLLTEREVKRIIKLNPAQFEMQTVQSLTVGCVKIELCLYSQSGKPVLGYDIFVKDNPESPEWICYESIDAPNESLSFREDELLAVLDRTVRSNGLSYTECFFERVEGKGKQGHTGNAS